MSRTKESVVARLAGVLSDPGGRIGMGEHAALRRMDPLSPGASAIIAYRLLAAQDVPLDDEELMRRWCLMVHVLALARGAHDPRAKIGEMLWKLGLTEARINQLLAADFPTLIQLAPRLARRLHASSAVKALDFMPLAGLILNADRDAAAAHRARLTIALSVARNQSVSTTN